MESKSKRVSFPSDDSVAAGNRNANVAAAEASAFLFLVDQSHLTKRKKKSIRFGRCCDQLIRRRRQHQKGRGKSLPLTEEMLNELNKNHMGGVDNLASESFYDLGDAWDRPKSSVYSANHLERPMKVRRPPLATSTTTTMTSTCTRRCYASHVGFVIVEI